MPRLGDDPNMATAYPERVNLRGSWMRQLLYTVVLTLVMYKVVFKDYKVSVGLRYGTQCWNGADVVFSGLWGAWGMSET